MICDDVRGLRVSNLSSTPTQGDQPMIKLVQSADAWISDTAAPAGTKTFLSVEGADSANILMSGCDLRAAGQPTAQSAEVPPKTVTGSGNIVNS